MIGSLTRARFFSPVCFPIVHEEVLIGRFCFCPLPPTHDRKNETFFVQTKVVRTLTINMGDSEFPSCLLLKHLYGLCSEARDPAKKVSLSCIASFLFYLGLWLVQGLSVFTLTFTLFVFMIPVSCEPYFPLYVFSQSFHSKLLRVNRFASLNKHGFGFYLENSRLLKLGT